MAPDVAGGGRAYGRCMSRSTMSTTAIAVLAAAAVAAPSAGAQPIDPGVAAHHATASQPQPVTRTVEIRSDGFDWADAGLGAAGMLSLLGLGAGVAVFGASRSRARPRVGQR
jgi:hypothetical protein